MRSPNLRLREREREREREKSMVSREFYALAPVGSVSVGFRTPKSPFDLLLFGFRSPQLPLTATLSRLVKFQFRAK